MTTKPDRAATADRIKAYFDYYTTKGVAPDIAAQLLQAEMLYEISGTLNQISSSLQTLNNSVQKLK